MLLQHIKRDHDQFASLKICRGADKSLARPGRKQATATENFDFTVVLALLSNKDNKDTYFVVFDGFISIL